MAEAHEARRHARDDRRRFDGLAAHRQIRADDGERARRRNAEMVHRFRAQKLADRGTQHCAAVAHARVGRASRALQLHFEALAGADFA
jgi:hypothetical protein